MNRPSQSTPAFSGSHAPLIGVAACACGFALVTLAAYEVAWLARADAAALAGLYSLEQTWLDVPALVVAHTADPLPWLAALAVLAWCGLHWGRGREAVAAGGAALVAVVLSQGLKIALAHPRTQAVTQGYMIGPEALPSGHATAAMSVAVTGVLCAPDDLRRRAVGMGATYAWVVGVALVISAWHLPSDVMAGMFLAAGCGFASRLTVPQLPAFLDRPRGSAPTVASMLAGGLVIAGTSALIVAVIRGGALSFAYSNRGATVTVVAIGLLATLLLAGLSRSPAASGQV